MIIPTIRKALDLIAAHKGARSSRFEVCLARLLEIEGGLSDRPLHEDPGGRTMYGVTQKTYAHWRAGQGLPSQDVVYITKEEAAKIYKTYWKACKADLLPVGLDWYVFDIAVNSGPTRAIMLLQKACHVRVDGKWGPITARAVAKTPAQDAIGRMNYARLYFMRGLANYEFNKNGWEKRARRVEREALRDAGVLEER